MGGKDRKRARDPVQDSQQEEAPAKRRRQITDERLKLSKLYEDLSNESDEVRLEAAKELIIKFSPENKPSAKEVEDALGRLLKGLCSQRKAARVGFSLTLTELLRQIFGQNKHKIEGFGLDAASVIELGEEKTKVEGNVPGRERRDHLIGKLFCYKAILQSSIVLEPKLSLECWTKLLDRICELARDVPWLREECGMVLVEAVKSLKGQKKYQECAKEMIVRLRTFKLLSTPQGVAVWLTVQSDFSQVLVEGVWHNNDPLSKKERTRLAKILKENFHGDAEDGTSGSTKNAAANPNPSFTWDLVLTELLRRDEQHNTSNEKREFPQFWTDTVDSTLFSSTSSHERKAWGFKLLSTMITRVPDWAVPALFSPNLMRTLINQTKKEARFLHSAALSALTAIQARVQQDPDSAHSIFVALTTKHGSTEFDRITKTKTLEQILQAADDDNLNKIVRHLEHLILRPESEEDSVAASRRQVIGDLLLTIVKRYARYDDFNAASFDAKSWLRSILEILVNYSYFIPSRNAKTSLVPLPAVSERSRTMFQERLSSCLTKLLTIDGISRSSFALMIVGMIRSKTNSSKNLELAFKAEDSVLIVMEKASQTLDSIAAKGSIAGDRMAAEGFTFLYSLTLLQVYNGEGDAVMMLEDLDTSRKALLKKQKDSTTEGKDVFVEIILSFVGNQRTLYRKIGEEAFSIFASEISSQGLASLTDILDIDETPEGQKELFNQADEDAAEETEPSSDASEDDLGNDSDVEMIDDKSSEDDASSDSESGNSSDGDSTDERSGSEDDAELTQFNNLLALTLQTSKPNMDGDAEEDSSDESDMDDEQMMALDPHLSKIFTERSKTTSKKKEREDAKQNVIQFKSRVLDLLAIYLEKQYSNPLTLEILLPVLRRTRATANKQIAEKGVAMLKAFFDSRTKHKAPLPRPEEIDEVWEVLRGIHEEAKLGGGAKTHSNVCSLASLHLVKVLVGLDRANYDGVVDVYSETQKQWFMDNKSQLQADLFMQFQLWTQNARKQGK